MGVNTYNYKQECEESGWVKKDFLRKKRGRPSHQSGKGNKLGEMTRLSTNDQLWRLQSNINLGINLVSSHGVSPTWRCGYVAWMLRKCTILFFDDYAICLNKARLGDPNGI